MIGVALAVAFLGGAALARKPVSKSPPELLHETGLYADVERHQIDPQHLEFSPQYPLWSDGAVKRRWISLPARAAIDGSNPDVWVFPVGTRFWKEFSFGGRRIETRYMERQGDGTWRYATYAWNEDQTEARLVSEKGRPKAFDFGGGRSHFIPSIDDCKSCHRGHPAEVLGFGTLQLSPARDPNAIHGEPMPAPGVDLGYLVENKLLKRLPRALLKKPPVIDGATPAERAVLGYLHGNCSHCHNDAGSMRNLGFSLQHVQRPARNRAERAIATAVGQPVRGHVPGQAPDAKLRIEPGQPERSVLLRRMSSRNPLVQMPPVGTVVPDDEAIRLVAQWIRDLESPVPSAEASGKSAQTK
ncbi:hypothetical protein [Microvirga makkahensis]|uniref:Cytochrome c domain-containing protein n=1 Tax=Microvirga makkahensis TaxID=1128670 RepID=A0A7X3SMD1_9HYPH|nr:hypothetical protein [Microvirga makkahensis]MXQ09993.1 hypothetical protein [Microvirga makkahensis]